MVNNGSKSASYVEVDETPNEDYGQDVLKLDADKEAHDQGEPSGNDFFMFLIFISVIYIKLVIVMFFVKYYYYC